jgi:hypothetical protein
MSNKNAVIKYYKGNETKDDETDGHVAHMREIRSMYETEVRRQLGKPRRRWEDNTKLVLMKSNERVRR